MAQELFGRSFRITLQDKQFGSEDVVRPLSFSFAVERDKTIVPNNAKIVVHNLSPDTRKDLSQLAGKKGITVRIEAGYGDQVGQIFFGVLHKLRSWRDDNGTWHTELSGRDQHKGKKQEDTIDSARINRTFPKNTSVVEIIRALVKALNIGDGNINNTLNALQTLGYLDGGVTTSRAVTLSGDATQILEAYMRSCGFEWSIQDGKFLAGPKGTALLPGQGPLFSPQTGLIGTPQLNRKGQVVGKALLTSDLIPGRTFRVQSEEVTGNFVAERTKHYGDSTDKNWYIDFLGNPPEKGSLAEGA